MIDSNVLMRRAIRWCADRSNHSVDTLWMMPTEAKLAFQDWAISVRDDMEFNQLKYFRPFEHQDRKSTRLNSSHMSESRMPSSA